MVALARSRPVSSEHAFNKARSSGPLHLIHGSFSTKKVARQFPVLAGFHKATDGALFGVLIAVVVMSAFSLHWRYLWTVAYTRLEATRDLAHRLTDSTAMLEQHLLQQGSLPYSMVRTKASNLIYLENPGKNSRSENDISKGTSLSDRFVSNVIKYGY